MWASPSTRYAAARLAGILGGRCRTENVEILRKAWEALKQGDLESTLDAVAPDIEWT